MNIRLPGLRAPLNRGHFATARNRLLRGKLPGRRSPSAAKHASLQPTPAHPAQAVEGLAATHIRMVVKGNALERKARSGAGAGPRPPAPVEDDEMHHVNIFRDAQASGAVIAVKVADRRIKPVSSIGPPTEVEMRDLALRFFADLRTRPSGRVLEVGSRARSGVTRRDQIPSTWEYAGFDIIDGPNVDLVGDAHQLSQHFPYESFDAVFAMSVLEHILMPWKFAIELNRVMRPGAVGLFTTHHTWPLHEKPWDFWRFSDQAWKAILNPATGFEIIETQLAEPAFIVPRWTHAVTNFGDAYFGWLTSCVRFRKIGNTSLEWPVEVSDVTDTVYPSVQT